MRGSKVLAVLKREYMSRVKTKAFWISTALIPVFMIGVTVMPTLTAHNQGASNLGIVDRTGRIFGPLNEAIAGLGKSGSALKMTLHPLSTALDREELDALVEADSIDAYIVITDEAVAAGKLEYRARVTTNIFQQEILEGVLGRVFTADRLRAEGFDPQAIEELSTRVHMAPVGVGKAETEAAGAERFAVAYILFFLLYMMLLIYGQNILRGVLEEKSSRIVEIVVSSLRPAELLVGKIIGIGAVGLTQLAIWILCAAALAMGPSLGVLAALGKLPTPPLGVIMHFIFLFLSGFFLYSGLFAAVGAMHNNEQEAQQYNMVVMMPIIVAAVIMFGIISAPSSTLAVVLSLIPLFTPLIMLGRIAVGAVPVWQAGLGYLFLIGFIAGEYYLVARIYRVGILMYGKRPTLPELVRWVRY